MSAASAEHGRTGRTVVTERALRNVAVGIAHEIGRVAARDVSVTLADADGALRVSLVLPVALGAGGTIVERGTALREGIRSRMAALAAREVREVDVRFSRVDRGTERRVA